MGVGVTLYGIIVVLLFCLAFISKLGPDALRHAILRSHARRVGHKEWKRSSREIDHYERSARSAAGAHPLARPQ